MQAMAYALVAERSGIPVARIKRLVRMSPKELQREGNAGLADFQQIQAAQTEVINELLGAEGGE